MAGAGSFGFVIRDGSLVFPGSLPAGSVHTSVTAGTQALMMSGRDPNLRLTMLLDVASGAKAYIRGCRGCCYRADLE